MNKAVSAKAAAARHKHVDLQVKTGGLLITESIGKPQGRKLYRIGNFKSW
jgi:hypothetical protein